MTFRPGAFLRTTLPLDLSRLAALDSGRYHSIWLPDHLVSLWPDAIWTPEFTDLTTTSPSPHRHLDAFAVAAAAAVLTERTPIATAVIDTVRRHPAMLAQTALTIDHLSRGRFILGLGAGEMENAEPYGFDFSASVSRFEESLHVIRLLWDTDGPVDFAGRFFHLEQARLDTEPYEGLTPPFWIGAGGPRMIGIAGRYAEGWWPVGAYSVESYAEKLSLLRQSARDAGRDPNEITTAAMLITMIGADDELHQMASQPLLKSYLLQVRGDYLRELGHQHPMGDGWKGIHDFDPRVLTRDRLVDFLDRVDPEMVLAAIPHGSPQRVAEQVKAYVDAGLQVPKIIDYGPMAGLEYADRSPQLVAEAEDALVELVELVDGTQGRA